jgi:hypothetical protein
MAWMFVCRLNAHDFYLLTVCNSRELRAVRERIGERCPLCGAPIDVLDIAQEFARDVRATPSEAENRS